MTLTYKDIRGRQPRYSGSVDYPLHWIAEKKDPTEVSYLNLDPPYQRGRVWTAEQAGKFVAHILETGERVPIIAMRYDLHVPAGWARGNPPPDEVLDGKQRLTALLSWWADEIPALLSTGEALKISDFSAADQRLFGLATWVHVDFIAWVSEADTLRRYLAFNTAGSIHAPDEIARVKAMLQALVP